MENEIQPNVPPVQPSPQTPILIPTQPSTNWSKILLFVVLGLVTVAGLVFIGIQIGKNQTFNQQPITVQPTTIPTQASVNPTNQTTIEPTTDPTTDWKTYSNTSYGLSLLFPKEWESCMTQGTRSFLLAPGKCKPPYADYYLQIDVLTDTKEVSVYAPPGDPNAYTSTGKQIITLGSNQFIKQKFTQTRSYEWNDKQYPAGPVVIFYDLVDSNKNRVIEFYKSPFSNTDEATIEKILSTFKSTN